MHAYTPRQRILLNPQDKNILLQGELAQFCIDNAALIETSKTNEGTCADFKDGSPSSRETRLNVKPELME